MTVLLGSAAMIPGPALAGDRPSTGDRPVRLVVGLRAAADGAASVRALSAVPGVDVLAEDALGALAARTVEVPGTDQAAAIAALRRDPNVRYVEVAGRVRKADVTPNDPYFSRQYEFGRIGVPTAWDTTTGAAGVTVAVVDTGVSAVGDLSAAVLTGWDYVNRDADASDDEGHGTAVASLVAARGDDAAGMAGVCWGCRILPVKVLDARGEGSTDDVAAGIAYAADRGAQIINLSLGGYHNDAVLRDAVAYARRKGALVVAAAGNDGNTRKNYPAALPGVLAVGGTDTNDERYADRRGGSNYGADWVDVAAPFCTLAMTPARRYSSFCGTSASTPLVSGVAALVYSAQPTADAEAVANVISWTSRPLSGDWLRSGLVRAGAAIVAQPDTTPPTITGATPEEGALVRGTVTIGATGVADSVAGVARASLYVDGKYIGRDATAPYAVKYKTGSRNGTVKVQWRIYDRAGNSATFDRSLTADNTKPKVKITSGPKNKAKVKGTVKLAASASDKNGIDRVELLINGKVVATDRTAKYTFSIKVSKYGKKLKVQVRAYDKAGNSRYDKTRNWKR